MLEQLIQNAANLMREQTAAYRRLEHACQQLGGALVNGQPEAIESLTRAGETELLRMRARLVELMNALATFADRHAAVGENALSQETRETFRAASHALLEAARDFQRTQARVAAVANNGATFAATGIQICGVAPLTYRAPYARRNGEAKVWA